MSKTLTVSEEAYEKLASKKEPGESFSEVIVKITGKASVLDLAGTLTEKEAQDMLSAISERRKIMRKRVNRTGESIQ